MAIWLIIAGLNGALAAAAAAYSSHGLIGGPAVLEPAVFQTAVEIQLWHALALLGIASLAGRTRGRGPDIAGGLITLGIVLFCGSTYAIGITGEHGYATLAPYGGTSLILGWLMICWIGIRAKKSD